MEIEEIYEEFEKSSLRFRQKANLARIVAKKAYKKNNMKKWDKFNAIARVYDMTWLDIAPLLSELLDKTSKKFQEEQISF